MNTFDEQLNLYKDTQNTRRLRMKEVFMNELVKYNECDCTNLDGGDGGEYLSVLELQDIYRFGKIGTRKKSFNNTLILATQLNLPTICISLLRFHYMFFFKEMLNTDPKYLNRLLFNAVIHFETRDKVLECIKFLEMTPNVRIDFQGLLNCFVKCSKDNLRMFVSKKNALVSNKHKIDWIFNRV